ncbi:MAG: hypothetical protein DMF62_13205 [Acidobacteria bacterium]|nr:MAG: hypothetical protein DMF62_13205 [Acidobacteriota bacterium]
MNSKAAFIFHGFLQLPNLEKLDVVNAINDYFDSTEREPIRAAADAEYEKMRADEPALKCPCCGN